MCCLQKTAVAPHRHGGFQGQGTTKWVQGNARRIVTCSSHGGRRRGPVQQAVVGGRVSLLLCSLLQSTARPYLECSCELTTGLGGPYGAAGLVDGPEAGQQTEELGRGVQRGNPIRERLCTPTLFHLHPHAPAASVLRTRFCDGRVKGIRG